MQTLHPPAIEIPIEEMWTGGFMYPLIDVDQSSGRVAVSQRVESVAGWDRFIYDLPDWMFAVCVVVLAYFVVKFWRTVRSPRMAGRLVCVKCAYDLTPPPGGKINARCPECGIDTAKRAPVVGRSLVRRMLVPTVLSGVVLVVAIAILAWRLEPANKFSPARRWPPLIWRSLSGWVQLQRRAPRVSAVDRIDVWSATEGRVVNRINVALDPYDFGRSVREVRLFPGGEFLAVTTEVIGVSFRIVRVADGSVLWTAPVDVMKTAGSAGFAGVSADGQRAWFWLQHGGETELFEVALKSGELRSVEKVIHPEGGAAWHGATAVATEDGGRVVWASMVATQTGAALAWPGGNATITGVVRGDYLYLRRGTDSAWEIQVPDRSLTGAKFVWSVPLTLGTPAPRPAPAVAMIHTRGRLDVSDLSGKTVVKSLSTVGALLRAVMGRALPADRWHAATGERVTPPYSLFGVIDVGSSCSGAVQVWDISVPVPAPKP